MKSGADRPERLSGDRFLDLLADPGQTAIDSTRVMAVFAHPDDETIAIGGQLRRLKGIRLMHVTDGAPADMRDAEANGFARRKDYAAARKEELAAAVAQAGVPREALLSLGAMDQATAYRMPVLASLLSATFRSHATAVVITHGYEGGHPDHDATAFIVRSACLMLQNRGSAPPDIIECPLYHARNGERVAQDFIPAPGGTREVTITLDSETAELKRSMLSAHVTQRRSLTPFHFMLERFRVAPKYDFSQLPNGGELLYEQFDWGFDGKTWLRLAQEAREALGLPRWR